MKKFILLSCFIIYSIICLTQNFQVEHTIFSGLFPNKNVLYCADINNDGNIDAISASGGENNTLMWLENNGEGKFNLQHIIETGTNGGIKLFSTDIDNDGDMDIIASLQAENSIVWFENIYNGVFSQKKMIFDSVYKAYLVFSIDIDNDGDNDVLSSTYNGNLIYIHKNMGNGEFETNQTIVSNTGIVQSIYAIDLDNDGDNDILAGLKEYSEICWYENLGNGNFGEQQTISDAVDYPKCVIAADLDNDGDNDVISASYWDGKIAWYENQGSHIFSDQHILTKNGDRMLSVFVSDLDSDGDLDIISGSSNEQNLFYYENLGNGNFQEKVSISEKGGGSTLFSADFDNDGDNDIISNNFYFNNLGTILFDDATWLFSGPNKLKQITSYDLDNDLDKDILYASSFTGAGYFLNMGIGQFENNFIYNPYNFINARSITTSDINNNGQQDILIGSFGVLYHYYINNENEIIYQGILDTIPNFIESLTTSDFNNDNDTDILVSTMYIDYYGMQQEETRISWIENLNNGNSWKEHILYSKTSYDCFLKSISADYNSDGKVDIISTNCLGDSLYFYKNFGNGVFEFSGFKMPNNFIVCYLDFADVDSDNDLDIIATTSDNSKLDYAIIWLENSGLGTFTDYHIIDDNAVAYRLLVADLDNDGDEDIVANTSLNIIGFYYNDGNGNFTLSESFESENCYFENVSGTDMDYDGDVDILYIGNNNKIAWIENNFISDISMYSQNQVKIYPNPAKDFLNIDISETVNIEIYNYYGELVLSTSKKNINMSSLTNGIYQIIVINNNDNKIYSEKVIKL